MKPFKLDDYKHKILQSGERRGKIVRKNFANCTYEEILYYIKNTPVSLRGMYKYSLQYLKCESYSHVYKQHVGCLKEPLDYVGLMAYIFPLYSSEINDFIKKREEFARCYLNGYYSLCSQIIKEVNERDGYSAWAAINTIKLAGLQGGLEGSLKAFNGIYEQGVQPLMEKTCSAAQDTASIETSMDTFLEKKYQEDIDKYSSYEWQQDYITAHYYPFKRVDAGKWMSYDLRSSIIDLYVNFIYNISSIIEKCREEKQLCKYFQIIASSIDDDLLRKKMSFLDLCEYRNNIDRKNLLELFAMNMPLNNSKWLEQYFEKYPYDLDLLYEYVSYLVRNHIRDFVMFNDESLFSTIGRHLYHYLKGQNKVTSLNKLKKICLSNSTLLCFRQLYVILSNIEKGNLMMYPNGYWLNSYGLNFYDSVFFADKSRRQQFLKANDFFLVDDFKSNHLLNINLLRQIILLGNIQDTCIIKLLSKLLQEDVPSYLQGAILSSVFSALVNMDKYKEAIIGASA